MFSKADVFSSYTEFARLVPYTPCVRIDPGNRLEVDPMDIMANLLLNTLSLILADLLLEAFRARVAKNHARGGPCDETMQKTSSIEDLGGQETLVVLSNRGNTDAQIALTNHRTQIFSILPAGSNVTVSISSGEEKPPTTTETQ